MRSHSLLKVRGLIPTTAKKRTDKHKAKQSMVVHSCDPSRERLRQDNQYRFGASLGYILSSRPAWLHSTDLSHKDNKRAWSDGSVVRRRTSCSSLLPSTQQPLKTICDSSSRGSPDMYMLYRHTYRKNTHKH